MTHRRTKIRDFVENLLVGEGFAVDQSSEEEVSTLPYVRVQFLNEDAQIISRSPLCDDRQAQLNIEVYDSVRTIDDQCEVIEQAILTDPSMGGLVQSSDYSGYTLSLTEKNSTAQAGLSFLVKYITEFTDVS